VTTQIEGADRTPDDQLGSNKVQTWLGGSASRSLVVFQLFF
jgi:hypothetical protein